MNSSSKTHSYWALVLLVPFLLWLVVLPNHIVGGDNAEFVVLTQGLGIAHPPGYPLYVWLGQAARLFSFASPAWSAAFVNSLFALVAVFALAGAVRCWGASRSAALWTTTMLAVSPLFVHNATHAEVFALHAALTASVLALCGPQAPLTLRGRNRLISLGLLGGLAMAHHLSIVLLAPTVIYGAMLGTRETTHRKVLWLIFGLLLSVVTATLLYLSLLWLARNGELIWRWGDWQNLNGLFDHFMRREFGAFQVQSRGTATAALAAQHLGSFFTATLIESLGALLLLPVIGVIARVRNDRYIWALVAGFVGTLLLLALLTTPLEGAGVPFAKRFYLMPLLVLSLIAALGFDAIKDRYQRYIARSKLIPIALLSALVLTNAARSLAESRRWNTPVVENYLVDLLDSTPPNTVLLGTHEHRLFGLAYVQRVLKHRQDILYIDPLILPNPWYRRQIEAELGIALGPFANHPITGRPVISAPQLLTKLHTTGRPVAMANTFSQTLLHQVPNFPLGLTVVFPRDPATIPSPKKLHGLNGSLYTSFAVENLKVPLDPWAYDVAHEYTRTWESLADALERAGQPGRAEASREQAAIYTPQ